MMKLTEDFKSMIAAITDNTNTFISSPNHNHSPMPPDPTNFVPSNRRSPPLDGGQPKILVACGL